MIHNPAINEDLLAAGLKFIFDTSGCQLIDWKEITSQDIVIIPAFGTTLEIAAKLQEIGVTTEAYNTTCPFVEKVWKRSAEIGRDGFSVVIHGKHRHEETRATFSHSASNSPSVVVRDMKEAKLLADYIRGEKPSSQFEKDFADKHSKGFDVRNDLKKLGVVNQTTMLATETEEITQYLRSVMKELHGENWPNHFADTRDTLCYATNDNQDSTYQLLETDAQLALVVGGYNSSNTSHLVELCERKFPTYFIHSEKEIISRTEIRHFDLHQKKVTESHHYLPDQSPVKIILTSGASCPDSLVDRVLFRLLEQFPGSANPDQVLEQFTSQYA